MGWKISNDLPYLDEFPALYQLSEYPNALFHQVNGELPYKLSFPEMFDITDSPNMIWKMSDDIPFKSTFSAINEMGAFCHAVNLRNVVIPQSVKSIGRYAFTYTSLTSVTLADDCTYYPTSFPEGCVVIGGVLNA